jgi:hypothetical protein
MAFERVYERGSASKEELDQALADFAEALRTNEDLRAEARKKDISAEDLDLIARDGIHAEKRTDEKLTGLELIVIYIAAPVAVHVAKSIWDDFAKPWIEAHLAGDALKDRRGSDADGGPGSE